MHHYEYIALYKDISLQISEPVLWLLAAPDPGKRAPWMVFTR